jgi:hypothetical protein
MTAESQRLKRAEREVREWNEAHPVGTRVRYWTMEREGEGKISKTRSEAWVICGHASVKVDGTAGGIALTHVEPATIYCAYCGKPSEGNYTVHRDGFDKGPEVELCDGCGGSRYPTLSMIWDKIAEPEASA